MEAPLEIRVEGEAVTVTMRTPGGEDEDLELALGFLRTEGVIEGGDDVRAAARVGPDTLDVRLAEGVPLGRRPAGSLDRRLFASSACGICGAAGIAGLRRRAGPVPPWSPPDALLLGLPERLRAAQAGFDQTGGLHAAAWFGPDGEVRDAREDVGRHNAVDKCVGAMLRAGNLPAPLASPAGLVVSSRAGFEIVQKAWMAGFSAVAAMGAPTDLAVETAQAAGICLIGWLRPGRLARYS